ncbi:MAG TPA: hypothetical protein VFN38_09025 [Gemmatimonadaceae bacterium]|nr:hypothetical protein [Gemmatimonadaceae bacterium]
MSSRIVTTLRVIAGAIVGAIVGSIIVLVIASAVAEALGRDGGGAVGMIMMFYGVPLAILVGGILGGWAAGRGRSSGIFRFTAVTALALTGLAIMLAIALPKNTPKPVVDVKGCTISPRIGSFAVSNDSRYVVVYDRYCSGGEGHTVNVSDVPTSQDSILGPGNILVLAGDEKIEAATLAHQVDAYARIRDSLHMEIRFDHRAHVLSQASPVLGYEIDFQPTIGLPLPAPQPPEMPAALKALIEAQRDSFAARDAAMAPPPPPVARVDPQQLVARRESLMARRQRPMEPWVSTDTDGCTIRKRYGYQPFAFTYVVYERICPTEPQRTINLSQVAPSAPVNGPGNVLVLVNDEPARSDSAAVYIPVSITPRDARHVDIVYAGRFHPLSSGSLVQGVKFTFRADSNFRTPGPPVSTGGP